MERIKKLIAAFLLAVFMSSTVFAPKAKADFFGIADIGQGVLIAEQTAQLVELVAMVSGISEKVETTLEAVRETVRFVQAGYYSVSSLRILSSYGRTISQFVSDLATGRFYNYSSAVYAATNALRSYQYLQDVIQDFDKFLGGAKDSEGMHSLAVSVYDRISGAYSDLLEAFGVVKAENYALAARQFQEAQMTAICNGYTERSRNRYLTQFHTMVGPDFEFISYTELINNNVLNAKY